MAGEKAGKAAKAEEAARASQKTTRIRASCAVLEHSGRIFVAVPVPLPLAAVLSLRSSSGLPSVVPLERSMLTAEVVYSWGRVFLLLSSSCCTLFRFVVFFSLLIFGM